ncbi:hypothetical protein GALMADRAFT_138717 [Galerina marginata CBS 339.88]|uniref:Mid2 domain-containing protein n=1 Tax=Galerina marginata (strain CBS 339.88) TaxID=685588 RepID=A0A067T3C6_GALM3|nr:hypothetical protein GALMADRAFT_138717 [Galerina marginata CBS 339.88]
MPFSKGAMIVTLRQSALIVIIVSLSPLANAINFHYRFYNNKGCEHNSPSQDTFPLNGLGPDDQCLSAPQNGNWTTVELDNPFSTGGLKLTTFCDSNCTGAKSSEQGNTHCFIPAPKYASSYELLYTALKIHPSEVVLLVLSSSVNETISGVGTSSTTQSSNHPWTQWSNAANPMPSTVTVTELPTSLGNSSPTQSSDTSKSKISTGTVIGGVIGGFVAIAGLCFLLFLLRRRVRKRQRIPSHGIPKLATPLSPSPAATTANESHPMSLRPTPIQTTGNPFWADHSSRASVIVSAYDEHMSLNSGPDPSQLSSALIGRAV